MSTPKIVNKSGVVLTKDGQRLFGMDAAHYKKMQAKEDPEWDSKVLAWLEAVLGEKFETDDLWTVLKNGIVLIRIVNTLKPGSIAKYNKARLVPLLEMDNIQLYLKSCWNLGVPSESMFSSTELHKRQDMQKVTRNIEALSKIAVNFGVTVPPLDSAKKAPPKKVSLIDAEEDEERKKMEEDPVQMVSQLRDKIRTAKAACERLEGEEERLREEIKENKASWRDEKTKLVYAVSNAEKKLQKATEQQQQAKEQQAKEPVKKTVASKAVPVVRRTASFVMDQSMQQFAESQKREAEAVVAKETELREAAAKRKVKLMEEEKELSLSVSELKQLVAEEEELERRERRELEEQAARASAAAAHPPPVVAPLSSPAAAAAAGPPVNKRYTQMGAGGDSHGGDYFFYETDVTSREMVAYLTSKLEALFRNLEVSFEDLFKLKRLLETDEGRRVFCFVLFRQIRTKKRGRNKNVVLSSDSFDLVLWLFSTVLQSLSQAEDKCDFFATRVILKYSSRLVREVKHGGGGSKIARSKEYESIQRFIRSDSLWRTLSFWQELFYSDVNKKFKRKFSSTLATASSGAAGGGSSFSSKEKKFVLSCLEDMLSSMGRDWMLPRKVQELFLVSVAENVSLSASEMQKLTKGIIDMKEEGAETSAASSSLAENETSPSPSRSPSLRPSQSLVQSYSVKQKLFVFGAALRPRRRDAASLFSGERAVLDAAEAEHVLPTPILQIFLILEDDRRCLDCEGMFRQSGDAEELLLLRAKIEAGELIDYNTVSPHDIGALLKLYLRDLPEPLTTFDVYPIVQTADLMETEEQKFLFLRKLLSKLPDNNRVVLKRLLLVLNKYAANCGVNKMTDRNLAVVFAPALFRARVADMKGLTDASKYVDLLQYMMSKWDTVL